MSLIRNRLIVALIFALLTVGTPILGAASVSPTVQQSQDETSESQRERVAAERFLKLLKTRPRLGTALDKVYGFHVANGSLDSFVESLTAEAKANSDGNLWMIVGMVQMQRGQDALAVDALTTAEQLLPKEPLASYYLGRSLVLLGEVDKAADAMRRSIDRKPARADLLAIFKDLGRIFQRTGRNQEALDVWNQLEELFPNDTQVQEEIARVLSEEGANEAALERYTALARDLKDRFRQIEMAIRAAQIKTQLGRTDEALKDFETQLALVNPESWLYTDIRRRIEDVFWNSNNLDGLVDYYSAWITSHPEDVPAMMRLARVLAVQKQLPEAEKWFQQAIAKTPSNTEMRMMWVDTLATDYRFEEAAREMEKVVELQPNNPDFLVRWGELVFNDTQRPLEQRTAESNKIWLRLLDKRGDDPVTIIRVADLLRGTASTDAAIEHYRVAIEIAPNDPQYREYLGEYLHQLGRKEEAVTTWREIASGQHESRDNLVRLSEVFSTFGYRVEALATIAKACEMKPNFGHRARYAELLRDAKRYDDSLAQIELARPLAEDPELRELLVEEQIKNYQASGTLADRIDETEALVDKDGTKSQDPETWQLLALLRSADRKFQLACEAIEKATALDDGKQSIWETAALMQERAGRFGDAVLSYRKLASIDRRYLTNYLTQIALLEMRVGNVEAALKAGEELIAAAPGNADNYRLFSDLCFQAGQAERGLDVLRRNARSNPSNLDALVHLAKTLSDEFQTDEAMELYWRAFDLAKDLDGQISTIESLTDLYLRTNRFEALIERLETLSREQNKPREGILWTAAVHQSVGDFGMARQMLEQLARQDSRDTRLLEQLVKLSQLEFDFESAADFQKRLVAASPTPENEYRLANILLQSGEIDQAESLWLKLSRQKNNSGITGTITSLIGKQEYETADKLIQNTLESEPDNWEILAFAMLVKVKRNQRVDAREYATRVLAMNIDPATPTAKVKLDIEKRKRSSARKRVAAYNPYDDLAGRQKNLRSISELQRAFRTDRFYGGRNQYVFTPTCFGDVQTMARLMPVIAPDEGFNLTEFVNEKSAQALESNNADDLWNAVFLNCWANARAAYASDDNSNFLKCTECLVELGDPYAAMNKLTSMINRRQSFRVNDDEKIEPLSDEELDKVIKTSQLAGSVGGQRTSYILSMELIRSGRVDEAIKLFDESMESLQSDAEKRQVLAMAISALTSSINPEPLTDETLAAVKTYFDKLLRVMSPSPIGSRNNPSGIPSLSTSFAKADRMDLAIEVMDKLLRWQARCSGELRPSLRDRIGSNNTTYLIQQGNSYQEQVIAFPPQSGYCHSDTIVSLKSFFATCEKDSKKLASWESSLETWSNESTDDPYLGFVRKIAKASFEYWNDDLVLAEKTLAEAEQFQIGGLYLGLARARLFYEAGNRDAALQAVEKLRPTSQQMLVDRELTILQLLLEQGNVDRARESAQKLFALRLSSNTEFKLADLMYQLGMRDYGDRMMSRIRRRAGGKQDTLVQLMNRYAQTGDNESAAEVARQVLRRSQPSNSRSYRTSSSMQHEQALRVLAQTKQLQPLIEQYEKLLQRSPKSRTVATQLAAIYEAAGRREDAQKLVISTAEKSPTDPRSLLEAGKQLHSQGKSKEAVEKFLAALSQSPTILDQGFYDLEGAFTKAKAWGRLVDTMTSAGMSKFSQSYRISEIIDRMMSARDFENVNRLMVELVKSGSGRNNYWRSSLGSKNFKPSDELRQVLEEKLCDASFFATSGQSSNLVYSRGSNGRVAGGTVFGLAQLVATDQTMLHRVATAVEDQLKAKDNLEARVFLALLKVEQKDFDASKQILEPILKLDKKSSQDVEAIWCVASKLTHEANQPAIACELLETIPQDDLAKNNGSGFQYTTLALLSYSYSKCGDNSKARDIIVSHIYELKIDETQNVHNPGYGDSQYVESLVSACQQLLSIDMPLEALIAHKKAFEDQQILERASRWGGSYMLQQRKSILQQIMNKINRPRIEQLIALACTDTAPENTGDDSAKLYQLLLKPQITQETMVNARMIVPAESILPILKEKNELISAARQTIESHPLRDQKNVTLRQLHFRLLLAITLDDASLHNEASEAILRWADNHSDRLDSLAKENHESSEVSKEKEKVQSSQNSSQAVDKPELLDALLLGSTLADLAPEFANDEKVTQLLDRASTTAEVNGQRELALSFKCQFAKTIAAKDPDRAQAILRATLDEILPPKIDGETDDAKENQ